MTTEQVPSALPVATLLDVLSKDEIGMLWQLLNVQGAATSFSHASVAAALYEKTRAAAKALDIPTG